MRNNPYQDDPINIQPTDVIPPLPDLPQKQVPQTPPVSETVSTGGDERVSEGVQEEGQSVKFVIGKIIDYLQWFAIVLEVLLFIRFFFKLIGADPSNVFTSFLYALTDILLFPFSGIVHNPSFHPNEAFEITTLIGMALYWLFFWLLRSFVRILISEPKEPDE